MIYCYKGLLQNFFQQFDKAMETFVFLYPNELDIVCSTNDSTQAGKNRELCYSSYINTSFQLDPLYPSTTINTINNQEHIVNQIRVFDSIYKMMMRDYHFDSLSIVKHYVQLNNELVIQLNIWGNIASFVLTRPTFMSFGRFGLYQIIYTDGYTDNKNSNAMAKYTFCQDQSKQVSNIYLRQIKSKESKQGLVENAIMYPKTDVDLLKSTDLNISRIYYLNYDSRINQTSIQSNSFFIAFNKTNFPISSNYTYSTLTRNLNYIVNITFQRYSNKSTCIINGTTYVIIDHDLSNEFYIFIVYSYNVMTIYYITNKCLDVKRIHSQYIFEIQDRDDFETFIKKSKLNYKDIPCTCVPNMHELIKTLPIEYQSILV